MKTHIILDFVAAINNADVDKICDLMTIDHIFIDSQDNRMEGKENIKQAWIGYFGLFPDYKIEINEILVKDSLVCAFGYAGVLIKIYKLMTKAIIGEFLLHGRPSLWKII